MTRAAPAMPAPTRAGAQPDPSSNDRSPRTPRWAVVDVVRGAAIVAVVAFHLTWDLGDLGLISWRISAHGAGKVIAHAIAGTFLYLVGVSLVLAHRQGIRWRSFWRREVQLVALALVITAVSAVYQPREVVTFGMLHAIALVSFIALPLVPAPRLFPWALAVGAVALPWLVHLPGRSPWISWTGLADGTEPSLDWQPVLPWIALTFIGIGVTRWLLGPGKGVTTVARLRSWQPGPAPLRWLGVLGRHTLGIYVVHQPVLYGALWLVA